MYRPPSLVLVGKSYLGRSLAQVRLLLPGHRCWFSQTAS